MYSPIYSIATWANIVLGRMRGSYVIGSHGAWLQVVEKEMRGEKWELSSSGQGVEETQREKLKKKGYLVKKKAKFLRTECNQNWLSTENFVWFPRNT